MKRHVLVTFYAPEAAPAGGGAAGGDAAAAAAAAAAAGGDGGAQTPEQIAAKAEEDAAAAAAAAGDKGDKGGKAGAQTEQPKAPDKYDLKLTDEARTYLDDGDVKGLEAFAKEMGLSNAQAQTYLEQHIEGVKGLASTFLEEAKADATFGGDSLEVTQRYANEALDAFAPKGDKYGDMVRTVLAKNGYGNHIGILAMLARAGKAMAEDKPGTQRGGHQPLDKADAASKLYDHPTSKAAAQ